jgi:hypothetical protein
MLRALERNIALLGERLVLLAPSADCVSNLFANVDVNPGWHAERLREAQRFRGGIYVQDGALETTQLAPDGAHVGPEDDKSWHMLLVGADGRLKACAFYLEHPNTVSAKCLRVRHSPLAHHPEWKGRLWEAMESELERARRDQLHYVEVGGWAVAEDSRGTSGPMMLALAVYGFSRRCRGVLGMTTATFRHCSSTILKRLGGARFESDGCAFPAYYDPRYNCLMEMLRFDSREPNPKYVGYIDLLREKLADVRVVTKPVTAELDDANLWEWHRSSAQPSFAN